MWVKHTLRCNCGRRESYDCRLKNREKRSQKAQKMRLTSSEESNPGAASGLLYLKDAAKFLWSVCAVWFGQDSMLGQRALQNRFG
jgi:hypothetical protein